MSVHTPVSWGNEITLVTEMARAVADQAMDEYINLRGILLQRHVAVMFAHTSVSLLIWLPATFYSLFAVVPLLLGLS